MKVLSVAWTIYDDRLKEFSNDCTGGGLLIKNICEYIGKSEDSYLFIGKFKLPAMELGNIKIVNTVREYDIQLEDKNEEYLQKMTLTFLDALDEIKPDIVNFHGIGVLANRCMEKCVELNVPFVYTSHLFIQNDRSFSGYYRSVEWQTPIFNIPEMKIIAVSTGMKKNILIDYPNIAPDNIKVIVNGTDFVANVIENDYREKYNLQDKKVLICSGTICDRKNQKQIIKSFKLLPDDLQKSLRVLFCGNDATGGHFQQEIIANGLSEQLIYVGALSIEEMKKMYSISDGLLLPSYSEGLSIAALEMIAYGKPVILFKDSECADDLNDKAVVCLSEERSDESFANQIVDWNSKDWDYEYIKNYAKKFTLERVVEEYFEYYKNILKNFER